MYVLWDVVGEYQNNLSAESILTLLIDDTDDTIARKVNSSDASAFAHICGCCPSQGHFNAQLFIDGFSDTGFALKNSMGCHLAYNRLYILRSWRNCWFGIIQGLF